MVTFIQFTIQQFQKFKGEQILKEIRYTKMIFYFLNQQQLMLIL